ncbi:hypothetical protein [Thermococcus peptonophilus]|uniref:Uncharacterized protein n=1 Tax=Thermococcus peptonophilus TaxID=53952 RepID=A0A142CU55_9EURY|nr:hypothetical protein [Thermococcus peptonophilus]AMQ18307.1 hypothetical protein A0127_03525 [Thermococcus peptonophilus]
MNINEKLAGEVLYALALVLSVIRPPVDRLACTVLPSGEVCTGINPFFLTLHLGLVMIGSLLVALGHPFKNTHERNGWLGVVSGLGIAIIGGFSELNEVVIFGALLATLGLLLYKLGGLK